MTQSDVLVAEKNEMTEERLQFFISFSKNEIKVRLG